MKAQSDNKPGEFPQAYYEKIADDREGVFRHTSFQLEEKLCEAVMEGKKEDALAILRHINASGAKAILAKDPLRSAKNSVICTSVIVARAVIRSGVAADEVFALNDAVILKIEELNDIEAVLAYEEELLVLFVRLAGEHQKLAVSAPVQKALHYIELHLHEKLSARQLAGILYLNPSYFGTLFHKQTGKKVSQYILERKLNESLYFVRQKNFKISEIAQLYGFSSESYYISLFKKHYQVSPQVYRNKELKQG